ncbi:biopolymer transporter ExbB [Celeribacter ethanolicus]|uniref:biopolymer transporter ExbB n=1 Tax=Celeribacter ethanolicus TaxID=1758178 RepID=UPI001FD216B6|nr:biopolymer transporter ExbB [Celeribacter ethanolicus]
MDQPDHTRKRQAKPQAEKRQAELKFFSQPVRQITLMIVVLGLVVAGLVMALPRVGPVFFANLYLNFFIAVVFFIGILSCFWQVAQLVASVNWIERFTGQRPNVPGKAAPRLLAPLAALLRGRGAHSQISASSSRSILDSVATRIDEARDITRYIANLLIFLGLLGTFYGLATTVPALVDTIRSLSPSEGEGASDVLGQLMGGLESQLGGMGTAFASSLLGLAGSLVVGMLELFATHGQNRFYRELEEWMSTITRIGFASDVGEGEMSGAVAVLDYMSEQMQQLQEMFTRSDAARVAVDNRLEQLVSSMDRLVLQMDADSGAAPLLGRIAEGQERLIGVMESRFATEEEPFDAEARMRLRSIDVQLLRILEELSAGRQESVSELRSELAELTRVLRGLGE